MPEFEREHQTNTLNDIAKVKYLLVTLYDPTGY